MPLKPLPDPDICPLEDISYFAAETVQAIQRQAYEDGLRDAEEICLGVCRVCGASGIGVRRASAVEAINTCTKLIRGTFKASQEGK